MTPEELLEFGNHLADLLDLEHRERNHRLSALAVENPGLARRLQRRLEADDRGLPEVRPILDLAALHPRAPLEPGHVLGSYRVIHRLGAGGMGEVYLAERIGDFEQRVAIKRIHPDADSPDFVDRFENERQILAQLEHPNIARILDGGTTPEGDPYFVMEYVDGERIDHYCQRTEASTRQRIGLVLQLCEAVLQSHRQLVIHRDIKPNNVLVTRDGVVKLLDFGIAKLVHRSLGGDEHTRHLPMGAPAWASPEYLEGEAVDMASDVYSLGVLLYSLLADRLPHDFTGLDLPTLLARLRHQPPRPPSQTRDKESMAVPRQRRISRDLDAIVLHALRYERWARYPSVEALANDLRSELEGRPVDAMGRAWRYRWGKFARRNRWPLATAGVVLLLGITFAITVTTLWRRAVEARDQAWEAQTRAERATAREQRGRLRSSTLLDTLLQRLEDRRWFGHPQPAVVLTEIGQTLYLGKGYQHAERMLDEAQRYRGTLPPEDRLILDSNLAALLTHRGEYARAEVLYDRVLYHRRTVPVPNPFSVAQTLLSYGILQYTRDDLAAAEQSLAETRQLLDPIPDVPDSVWATLALSQALLRIAEGRFDEAEALLREARSALGERRLAPLEASIEQARAQILLARGQPREAEALLRELLHSMAPNFMMLEWRIAQVESLLGECLTHQGRLDEAELLLVEGERRLRKERGADSIYARDALRRLRDLARAAGRPMDAPPAPGGTGESSARLRLEREPIPSWRPIQPIDAHEVSARGQNPGQP